MARENQGRHSPEQILAQAQAVIDTGDACSAARTKDEATRVAFWQKLSRLALDKVVNRESHAFKRPAAATGATSPATTSATAAARPAVRPNNVVPKRPPVTRAPLAMPVAPKPIATKTIARAPVATKPIATKPAAKPTAPKSVAPRPRRSISLDLGEPHTTDDALRISDEIFELCDVVCDMGDAGADFADSVREGAEEVMGWVEAHDEVTDGQFVSLENWRDGLNRWIK